MDRPIYFKIWIWNENKMVRLLQFAKYNSQDDERA